ncbi:MAG TPA: CinA family nicotinamide mononucleotide deamidase-related protein [Firmicutes bacterium]|nr:CinA family nicotinamide mononucleotide deamidase-related protein [Bacillota bacterium]
MIAEMVFVGTELLLGQIVNTNAAYLGERLSELGIDHYYQSVVGDNAKRLAGVLNLAVSRSDVVIACGGLGPTLDDLTRETVAELTGRELEFNDEIWQTIRRRRPNLPENMKRQAMVPKGAKVLPNDTGTAPGLAVPDQSDNKLFILLPGPPNEMKPMFDKYAVPVLLERMGERAVLVSRSLHFCEIGESPLEDRLMDLFAGQVDPTLATYAKPGHVQLRISTKAHTREEGLAKIAPVEEEIRRRVGEYIYGVDGTTLEEAVGELLLGRNWRVFIADAGTGGILASRLTDPPGANAWFAGALVAASTTQLVQMIMAEEQPGAGTGSEVGNGAAASEALAMDLAKHLLARMDGVSVGISILPAAPGEAVVALATAAGDTRTALAQWRGNTQDYRWRVSQAALGALRRLAMA